MANIIIIEDDNKVMKQFRTYFKELDENHRLRFFANSEDFQNVYLKNVDSDDDTMAYHPLFQSFTKEQMGWILSIELKTSPPFAEAAAKAIINADGKFSAFDNETTKLGVIFDKSLQQINELESASDIISSQFHSLWESFKSDLNDQRTISTALPFTNEDGKTWLLKVSGKKNAQGEIELVLRHQPDIFEPILATERKLLESEVSEDPEELQLLSTIHLIIFRTNNVKGNTREWVRQISSQMKELNYNPEDFRIRFVATMFEDDNQDKVSLLHPQLDDIIYLPLDRLIFLQKMEIILGFPGKTRPSFLFFQQGKIPIELSKRTFIERLSEVGFAIRNPVPLNPGVLSRFKFKLSVDGDTITTLARSHHSLPHPERPGEHLVHFYFFGISKAYSTLIRRHLSRANSYKGLLNEDDSEFEFSAENLFLSAREKETKQVIVLDVDADAGESVASLIRDSINQVDVVTESSYYLFLRNYLKAGGDPVPKEVEDSEADEYQTEAVISPEDIPPATHHDFFTESVQWLISSPGFELASTLTPPQVGDSLLGHDPRTFFTPGDAWTKLFLGPDNKKLLEETLEVVASAEKKLRRKFAILDDGGHPKWVQASFEPHAEKGQILVSLSPLEDAALMQKDRGPLEQLDMLVIAEELVPESVDSWMEGIRELAVKAGLTGENRDFHVVVLSDKISEKRHKVYRHSKLSGLHLKPLDVRAFLFELSVLLQAPFTKHNFDNQGWDDCRFPVHITKEVTLEGISEFGATLVYPTTIQPGTVLFLHESIFESAPNNCLAARFYNSEEHSNEKGMFSCSFLYYGITDAFLKHCRAWIRETYAAKKAKESG